jgi:DNA-binding MarR family transcriptional regulator
LVKQLDEQTTSDLIDHVGWRLWRLSRQWKDEFEAAMTAAGHGWMTQAQGAVVGHLRAAGVPQAELAQKLGVSKQAVQQFVDALEADGFVLRAVDPADKRGRIVQLTAKGAQALDDGNRIKQEIEARYRAAVGPARFADFMAVLDELFEDSSSL